MAVFQKINFIYHFFTLTRPNSFFLNYFVFSSYESELLYTSSESS